MDSIEDGGPPGIPPRGKAVIACTVIASGISGLVVALRFFDRLYPARLLGREDWCIFTAWIEFKKLTITYMQLFSIATSVGMCIQAKSGMAEHIDALSIHQRESFFKWAYLTIIFYNVGLACVKISILLLYLRVLGDLNYRKACYIVLSIVVIVSSWMVLSSIFFCVLITRNWDQSVPGVCFSSGPTWFANASLNIVTDFMILILPLPILPKVKQPRQQKISLYLIFAFGFFVCIVSILRIPSLIAAKYTHDPTMDSPAIAQWSVVELNTAIVCASLITLKPLVTRAYPRLLGLNLRVGRLRDPRLDDVPATVGSTESSNRRPNHVGTVSEGSTIRLNHDTFGIDSITSFDSETSESDEGKKTMVLQSSPTTQ